MRVGSLFAGIGGFELGLERAGMRTTWQVEREPFRRAVLARHFPGAKQYDDVRTVGAHNLAWVEVICGGFPCQDLSLAGKGAGIDGARSGLWSEYARIIGELRPRYVIVENVPALLARGFERVLGDLAALGYDAEWDCIPASALGAPHRRDRLWLVAYPRAVGWDGGRVSKELGGAATIGGEASNHTRDGRDTPEAPDQGRSLDDALRGRHGTPEGSVRPGRDGTLDAGWWSVEPDVGRVANGVPSRVDRLSALGDALVPQIAEWIGHRLMTTDA